MEHDLRSQWAIHSGIAFYRVIEQLYSKGQQTVMNLSLEAPTLPPTPGRRGA